MKHLFGNRKDSLNGDHSASQSQDGTRVHNTSVIHCSSPTSTKNSSYQISWWIDIPPPTGGADPDNVCLSRDTHYFYLLHSVGYTTTILSASCISSNDLWVTDSGKTYGMTSRKYVFHYSSMFEWTKVTYSLWILFLCGHQLYPVS